MSWRPTQACSSSAAYHRRLLTAKSRRLHFWPLAKKQMLTFEIFIHVLKTKFPFFSLNPKKEETSALVDICYISINLTLDNLMIIIGFLVCNYINFGFSYCI